MNGSMGGKPDYGNWVAKKFIYIPGVASLVFFGLALLVPYLVIPAGLFFLVSIYFAYARYRFSPQGGNVEDQVRELVLAHLDWNGEGQALDIGCGNAALTIKLAHKHARARVIGIDYWGSKWEYSKSICERNAKIEGVNERVTFQKASASALPFEDEYFDAVVSNLVFHEVRDVADKRAVIREALRMVKKGGKFAFQDLFLLKRVYGNIDELMGTIRGWGIRKVEFVETRDSGFIPMALKLPFMVGTIGLIIGEK
ncbi:MAG: class I SAM-dependent methyltransferase [Thermodesulfobacteriota bacterium]